MFSTKKAKPHIDLSSNCLYPLFVDTKDLQERLNQHLQKNRLKSTKQRDIIVETFFKTQGEHIKIEELLQKVREHNPAIGYATVYRTLMLLVDAGVAHQRHFHDGQSRFELDSNHHHDHLICTECGKIVEFENDHIENLQEQVAKRHGFSLTRHKMELYGFCSDCQNKG